MEIKFSRSQSLAVSQALAARNEKLKRVSDLFQQAQTLGQEAGQEYDAVLLEVLGEHGLDKLPDPAQEPKFVPEGAKRPEGIRWLDAAPAHAPAQGQAALAAAKAEIEPSKPVASSEGTVAPPRPLAAVRGA